MKKSDLILVQNREVNLVARYSEKYATNYYALEGLDQNKRIKNNSILTYFVLGINKRTKINTILDLSEPYYLTKLIIFLLYLKETNKRKLENRGEENSLFNYQQIEIWVLQKIIIYEDKIQNEFYTNSNQSDITNNIINSKIIKTFNSSGNITSLEMKGEALFKSFSSEKIKENKDLRFVSETEEKDLETNESYFKLGFNEFNMNITSNMELIHNEIDPKILNKLNSRSNFISFEKYKESNETLTKNEGKETYLNNTDTNSTKEKRNLSKNNRINFLSLDTSTQKISLSKA